MSEGRAVRQQVGQTSDFMLPGFVAAAHELKNPLALIRQLSQSLENGSYSQEYIEQMALRIRLTSERALRLAVDLTKAERLQDTLFPLEPVNPIDVCEDMLHELTPLITAKDRHVRLVARRRTAPVVANRDLLRRVLVNFVDNALEYSDASQPVSITTKTRRDGQWVRVSVRDYGPRIPQAIWKTVQSSKNQPRAIAMRPTSSGLGLYLASQFATTMNGKVGVIRHQDGASFYIDLIGSTQLSLL